MAVARRNRSQRGAAVFIVVMVLTLLTAIGIFAIRSSSLVNVASGHQRQAVQTAQLAEYATRAALSELSNPGSTAQWVNRIELSDAAGSQESCIATNRHASDKECHSMQVADILAVVQRQFNNQELLEPQTAATEGSLGPRLTDDGDLTSALEGRFRVEMHDLFDGPAPPGSDASGKNQIISKELTLSTYAQLRMTGAGSGQWCPEATSMPSASMQAMRVHVTLPAVPGG